MGELHGHRERSILRERKGRDGARGAIKSWTDVCEHQRPFKLDEEPLGPLAQTRSNAIIEGRCANIERPEMETLIPMSNYISVRGRFNASTGAIFLNRSRDSRECLNASLADRRAWAISALFCLSFCILRPSVFRSYTLRLPSINTCLRCGNTG
jgi:hypothetical protein